MTMSRKLKKELRERWGDDLNFEINRSLKKENWQDKNVPNARWQTQPFGLTECGKIDLRGFVFREPSKYQNLVNLDFSYAVQGAGITDGYGVSRQGSFIASIMESCEFVGVEMPASFDGQFFECNFSEAVFDNTCMAEVFQNCLFLKSKMKNVKTRGVRFVNCDFTKANLSHSKFYSAIFENCIFDEANFSGCSIPGSKFLGTRLSDNQIASCLVIDHIKFV